MLKLMHETHTIKHENNTHLGTLFITKTIMKKLIFVTLVKSITSTINKNKI